MTYPNIHKATFISRPNRFAALVELNGQTESVHVKNTGRCKELLVPGAEVWLVHADNTANRKTAYDLVAVRKGDRLINIDSQAPNLVFAEWANAGKFVPGLTLLKAEQKHGDSRFDFYWEAGSRKGFVEVKGVTLEFDGHAFFPDAPTERGTKHLNELAACRQEGYETAVCFVVQMDGIRSVSPNDATDPAFGEALRAAHQAGVQLMAIQCAVEPDGFTASKLVSVSL